MKLIPYNFAYLWGSLYFLGFWIAFYISMPKFRKAMIFFGCILMPLGIFSEYVWWTIDWWHPQTITNTVVGIEDVIMSFTHVGVTFFIYKFFFNKENNNTFIINRYNLGLATRRFGELFIFSVIPAIILFFIFGWHSFLSTISGMILVSIYIMIKRKDLIPAMLLSSILMLIIVIPVFIIGNIVSPGAIEAFWDFSQISGIKIIGIPIEDLIWYFLLGLFMGGSFEFLLDYKIIDANKKIGIHKILELFLNFKKVIKAKFN